MAKIRFGYSDDFTAKNNKVGINTTDSQAKLDVVGVVKGQDLKVIGISSQTGYEGFLRADHQIEEETQLNFGQGINASLSGEIIVGTGQTVTINEVVKETAGVGNQGNTRWVNLASNYGSGIISGANWTGKEFNFDGSNDKIEGPNPLATSPTTPLTFEAWAKTDTLGSWQTVMSISGTNTQIAFGSNNTIRFGRNGGSGGINADSEVTVTANTWYHIVGTYDGNGSHQVDIYVNGSLIKDNISMGSNGNNNGSLFRVGAYGLGSSGGEWLNGQVSLARVYSRALTSAEVSTNYNLGPFSKETSVTAMHASASIFFCLIISNVSSRDSLFISAKTTLAPCSKNNNAVSLPMPLPAPVITATLSCNLFI